MTTRFFPKNGENMLLPSFHHSDGMRGLPAGTQASSYHANTHALMSNVGRTTAKLLARERVCV